MSTDSPPACPQCGCPLRAGPTALYHREDDSRRTSRTIWHCSNRHAWWKLANRPAAPLEPFPFPDLIDD